MTKTIENFELFLYDLETTGLEKDCNILTIALSHVVRCLKNEKFIERSKELFYVKTEIPFEEIDPKALEINGLKEEQFIYEKCKTWKKVGQYVLDWIGFHTREGRDPLLIGWNNHKFDDHRLVFQNEKHGIVWKYGDINRIHTGDLIALFRKRNMAAKDGTFRLQSIAITYLESNQIEKIHFHEADGDVKAVEYLLLNDNDNRAFIDINKEHFLTDINIRKLYSRLMVNNDNEKIRKYNENNDEEFIKKESELINNLQTLKISNAENDKEFWIIKGKETFHIQSCGYFTKSVKEKIKVDSQDIKNKNLKPCSCSGAKF